MPRETRRGRDVARAAQAMEAQRLGQAPKAGMALKVERAPKAGQAQWRYRLSNAAQHSSISGGQLAASQPRPMKTPSGLRPIPKPARNVSLQPGRPGRAVRQARQLGQAAQRASYGLNRAAQEPAPVQGGNEPKGAFHGGSEPPPPKPPVNIAASGEKAAGAAKSGLKMGRGKIALLAGAGAAGLAGTGYAIHRAREKAIMKNDTTAKPTGGRYAAAGIFPEVHGAVAGKRGRKLRAWGNEAGPALLGGTAGSLVGGLATRRLGPTAQAAGATLGGYAGMVPSGIAGMKRNQRKGYLKPQNRPGDRWVAKSYGNPFGIDELTLINKLDDAWRKKSDMSTGRAITGSLMPGWHGAVAGREGKKLKAAGHELAGAGVGQLAFPLGGGWVGAGYGTNATQNKGYYKKQRPGAKPFFKERKKKAIAKRDDPFGVGG